MYNHELKLISKKIEKDGIGNDVVIEKAKKILCKVLDVGSSEFYNAKVSGIKPEIKFVIKSFEYEGEREVVFDGNKYSIIRTYHAEKQGEGYRRNKLRFDEIELTCEKVLAYGG